jgi:uncharacterized repeat protein (TIGR01451 family)
VTASADPVVAGEILTYRIGATNAGPAATAAFVRDPLPSGFAFVAVSSSRGSCGGNHDLACSLGTLAPGESATVTLRVRPSIPTGAVNLVSVGSGGMPDPLVGNNRAGVSVDVLRAGSCANELWGSSARETLTGTRAGDRIRGLGGNDRLLGGAGHDCLNGGSGVDRFDGGLGNDRVEARDGRSERVVCGPGRDRAIVDPADSVSGCERVERPRVRRG